jgi:AcrB/AcrD/AcrF family
LGPALVGRGARERLAPVLTSAAAIALVMAPFVVMGTIAGLEIVHPMAIVILCGLVSSTALSLFVLPALYLRFGPRQGDLSPEEDLLQRWVGAEPAPAGASATGLATPAAIDAKGASEEGEHEPAL